VTRLRAVIFDFDGVVVDSEPVHMAAFAEVLRSVGVELARRDYYGKYLGFDDHDCFHAALVAAGQAASERRIARLIARKTALVKRLYRRGVRALGGAVRLVREASAAGLPVGVCSGALREEIELAARGLGVREHFRVIVSAHDVKRGKPDPEGYRLARRRLGEAVGRRIPASGCVVVEDSPAGIQAARSAGMRVLAVTNSYPAPALRLADRVVTSLTTVRLATLEALPSRRPRADGP
jgi:HAD superfamily hydrolase (TIGR01509 family)